MMKSDVDESVRLLEYFHMMNLSIQYSTHRIIGAAAGAVMKLTLDDLGKYGLPLMNEYLTETKQILGLKEFSYKEDDDPVITLAESPFNHEIFGDKVICPLVLVAAGIIKRDGVNDISLDAKWGDDNLLVHVTQSALAETPMNGLEDLLRYFCLLDLLIQSSLQRVTGQASQAIMRSAVECMSQLELPSMNEYLLMVKNTLKLTEFSCEKYVENEVTYSVRIRGSLFAVSFNELVKPGVICPLVFMLACIIKKTQGAHVEVEETTVTGDGVDAVIRVYPTSWVEVLRLSKKIEAIKNG